MFKQILKTRKDFEISHSIDNFVLDLQGKFFNDENWWNMLS